MKLATDKNGSKQPSCNRPIVLHMPPLLEKEAICKLDDVSYMVLTSRQALTARADAKADRRINFIYGKLRKNCDYAIYGSHLTSILGTESSRELLSNLVN